MNKEFSNPEYQPKDFSEFYKSEIGKQLLVMREADKLKKLLPSVKEIPKHITALKTGLFDQLCIQIELNWKDDEKIVVDELAKNYPEFSFQLYEFFAHLVEETIEKESYGSKK